MDGTKAVAAVAVAAGIGIAYAYARSITPKQNTLIITTSPAQGDIYVDGTLEGTGSATYYNIPAGDHLVHFGDVDGYTTPGDRLVTIAEGEPKTYNLDVVYELAGSVSLAIGGTTAELLQ